MRFDVFILCDFECVETFARFLKHLYAAANYVNGQEGMSVGVIDREREREKKLFYCPPGLIVLAKVVYTTKTKVCSQDCFSC